MRCDTSQITRRVNVFLIILKFGAPAYGGSDWADGAERTGVLPKQAGDPLQPPQP